MLYSQYSLSISASLFTPFFYGFIGLREWWHELPQNLGRKGPKSGVQRAEPSAGERGVPAITLFLWDAEGGPQRRKEFLGNTPDPGKELAPFAIPLEKQLERNQTGVQKFWDSSWSSPEKTGEPPPSLDALILLGIL